MDRYAEKYFNFIMPGGDERPATPSRRGVLGGAPSPPTYMHIVTFYFSEMQSSARLA
jgi:hypothetical protein